MVPSKERGSRDLSESLLETFENPAFILDDSGTIRLVNQSALSLLGAEESDYRGNDFTNLTVEADRRGDFNLSEIGSYTEDQGMFAAELQLRTTEGKIVPVMVGVDELEVDGSSAQYLVTCRDLYALREKEEPARQHRANFRELFDKSGEALFLHDPETGDILDVNERMCELYGYRYEDALELSVEDLSSGRDPYTGESARHHIEKARENGMQTFEWEAERRDGSRFWVEVRLTPITLDFRTQILASVRDVTERKQVQEELQRREQRFRRLFNATAHALLMVDKRGRIQQINDSAERLFGYDAQELIGTPVERLVPEGVRENHAEYRSDYLENPTDRKMGEGRDLRAVRKDGEEIPVEVGLKPFDFDGDTKVLVDVMDISGRKQIQRRLNQLSEATDDVLWMYNADWTELLFVNSALESIYGVEVERLKESPTTFLDAVHPEDREPVRRAMEELSAGGTLDYEYRVNEAEDFQRHVWVNAEPIEGPDGEVQRIVGVSRDITERNREREELELKEHAMNSLQEGVVITDNGNDNRITYCNQGFLDLTGYDREEVLGRNFRFLQGEQTEEGSVKKIRNAVENEEAVTVELRNYRKDGSMFWNLLSITPVRNSCGEVTHFIGIQKNITNRKRIEQKLKERTHRLRESNEDLKNFANVVTHDLKQPLRTVASYVELLSKRFGDSLPTQAHDYIDRCVRGVRRMKELMDRLRTYSTVNFSSAEFSDVDLNAVLRDALESLLGQESVPEVTIQDLPVVPGDERLLEDLFRNLLDNALSYTEEEPQIDVSYDESDGFYRIDVADNGTGIDPEYHERIFEAFERLHTVEDVSGSGLGLSICRKIAELHHGSMELETRPGEGSTFTVLLPKDQSDPPVMKG